MAIPQRFYVRAASLDGWEVFDRAEDRVRATYPSRKLARKATRVLNLGTRVVAEQESELVDIAND